MVDDDVLAAESLCAVLIGFGWGAQWLSDGTAVVETVLTSEPDMVILDLEMPLLTGFDVAHALRAAHPLKPVVLIAFSGR
ncbi:response regulator [Cupriavidus basilensis]